MHLTTRRATLGATGIAALVFLPYLGAVGLWDPWETHYAEVGREMLQRGDLIHPHWENQWFFSKPALVPWLSALGLWLAGETRSSGELPRYTEWLIRLPFALVSLLAVALLSNAVSRLASPRAGFAAGFALATMPMWLFLSRQATTDIAYVGAVTAALACFAVAMFDVPVPVILSGAAGGVEGRGAWKALIAAWREPLDERAHRWALIGWALCGVAALAKGLLGVAFPLAVVTVTLLLLAKPKLITRLSPLSGVGVFLLVAGPWYAAMISFREVDAEGKTFFQRFFLHDHFARLASGVHTTTPGGSFTYYLEQGGFGLYLWVAAVPAVFARVGDWLRGPHRVIAAWGLSQLVVGFALFTASATRFHHYCLPMLPGVAILIGLLADDVREHGLAPHRWSLGLGAGLVALISKDLFLEPRRFAELFTYNHERPYPTELVAAPMLFGFSFKQLIIGFAVALVGVLVVTLVRRSGSQLLRGWAVVALLLALTLSWHHWVTLSHHWTQRDLFWRYWRQRSAGEPVAAFYMDWKGETFYSRNTVQQLGPSNWQREMPAYLGRTGRKWMLVEHARLNWLLGLIGPTHRVTSVEPSLNNKFVLLAVE